LIVALTGEAGEGLGPLDFFDELGQVGVSEETVEKWWCIGDERNRQGVWIQGKQIQ